MTSQARLVEELVTAWRENGWLAPSEEADDGVSMTLEKALSRVSQSSGAAARYGLAKRGIGIGDTETAALIADLRQQLQALRAVHAETLGEQRASHAIMLCASCTPTAAVQLRGHPCKPKAVCQACGYAASPRKYDISALLRAVRKNEAVE